MRTRVDRETASITGPLSAIILSKNRSTNFHEQTINHNFPPLKMQMFLWRDIVFTCRADVSKLYLVTYHMTAI